MQTVRYWGLRVAKVADLWSYSVLRWYFMRLTHLDCWFLFRFHLGNGVSDLVHPAPVPLRPPEYASSR